MGHTISWDNEEKSVILQQYHAPVMKDDLYNLARTSAEMMGEVSHTVHIILDERASDLIVTESDMRFLESLRPENQGVVALITSKSSSRQRELIRHRGERVAPKSFGGTFFVESIEEAREILIEQYGVQYSTSD